MKTYDLLVLSLPRSRSEGDPEAPHPVQASKLEDRSNMIQMFVT